ncbi:hypothetical protein AcW1_000352 [Taiwanofungus camphoratus]|nr:hypothetical protein AcV5_004252 [Antrodia cinnamomea]KAI0963211.1 hypothetical protein AcW1_000352 [Antrodia cinnamomea]
MFRILVDLRTVASGDRSRRSRYPRFFFVYSTDQVKPWVQDTMDSVRRPTWTMIRCECLSVRQVFRTIDIAKIADSRAEEGSDTPGRGLQ